MENENKCPPTFGDIIRMMKLCERRTRFVVVDDFPFDNPVAYTPSDRFLFMDRAMWQHCVGVLDAENRKRTASMPPDMAWIPEILPDYHFEHMGGAMRMIYKLCHPIQSNTIYFGEHSWNHRNWLMLRDFTKGFDV